MFSNCLGVEEEASPFSLHCDNLGAAPCLCDQICNNLSLLAEKKMKGTNLLQKNENEISAPSLEMM